MSKEIIVTAAVAAGAVILGILLMWFYMRRKYEAFAAGMYDALDRVMQEEPLDIHRNEETLESKLQMKLEQLADTLRAFRNENQMQKQQIQEMVSDISHQLKTPIANITMYSEMMTEQELTTEQQCACMQIVKGQVEKLDFLVQALVKMSRLEHQVISLKKEKEDLSDTLKEVIERVSPAAAQKGIEITLECAEPFWLYYDAKWTEEAIANVLDNAVKYTPEKGKIYISAERLELYSKITVKDSGIGIGKEHLNEIWKRFYRERKVHKEPGIGIGLYLTRTIIMQQNGYVKADSKEGVGSSFSLYLPNVAS